MVAADNLSVLKKDKIAIIEIIVVIFTFFIPSFIRDLEITMDY